MNTLFKNDCTSVKGGRIRSSSGSWSSRLACAWHAVQHHTAHIIAGMCIAAFSGCAVTPDSIIQQPTTAKASTAKAPEAKNGAIFSTATYKPMFEDRRARAVGDILTIQITENTSASKKGDSSASKVGSVDAKASVLMDSPQHGTAFSASSSNKYEDKAALNASNTFSGSVTVTVIEVLGNGNLVVSGEKQISLDKGSEFIRLSGVVNPEYIRSGNIIASSQVADARIEYRTNSRIDAAQVANILARFFFSFIPL